MWSIRTRMEREASKSAEGSRRKPRSLSATDSEWRQVKARADRANLSISAYLMQRALEPVPEDVAEPAPPPWLRRMARDILILTLLEEWRFEGQGAADDWQRLVARADEIVGDDGFT